VKNYFTGNLKTKGKKMNISSIVVQTLPKYLDEVVQNLKDCEVCDYHMHDEKGRIIITIEGEAVSEELEKLRVIEDIPHVIAADMQMSYSEDELDAHMEVIANGDAVPKMLNDDSIPASAIRYNGDLKKKEDLTTFAKNFDKTKR
jgi:nitrate reductase NapD